MQNRTIDLGIEEYTINLSEIYPDLSEREKFALRWKEFYNSDVNNHGILWKNGNILQYLSGTLVPTKKDNRPPLLLLFGNPAPHSVKAKMFFSSETNGREHRIWKVFREIGLLRLDTIEQQLGKDKSNVNTMRKFKLINLEYSSPFRVAIANFYSMPSTASAYPWAGVAGIKRLFGSKALQTITDFERKRIGKLINTFLKNKGIILAFQKDAYDNIKLPNTQTYSLQLAFHGALQSRSVFNPYIKLIGVPPTRLLYSHQTKALLQCVVNGLID